MYENHYSLAEKPFSLLPDPGYLYMSRHHQKALTLLEYGILNQAGFCVISGQPGSGKTTLIRSLLDRFDKDTTIGLLSNTHESFEELLAWILLSFDLPYESKSKTELYQSFVDFLIKQYANKRHTVLIIDEAQNMSPAALEELRMLSNINADKDQLLQMILVGQPGLLKNLQRPELRQFAQRIAVDYKLEAMTEKETCAYIRHRLKVAGTEVDIFDDSACKQVYAHSQGLPRLINLLCDTALVYGFAESILKIDGKIINEVVAERNANTILPRFDELNEDALLPETVAAELLQDVADDIEYALPVEAQMTSCGETMMAAEDISMAEVLAVSEGNDKNTELNSGVVSSAHRAPVTSLREAEYLSKAMDLNHNAGHEPQNENNDKDDDMNRTESNVIPVNHKVAEKLESESRARYAVLDNNIDKSIDVASRIGSSKLGFIILGIAFGVLISVAMLILSKMDNLAEPVVDKSEITGKMQQLENEFALKLQAIQQQREADIKKSRLLVKEQEASRAEVAALQRERDAALAIARARAELLQAKLKAERAAQNERLAKEKALFAQQRAQAAEHEAKLSQQRERESLSAVSRLKQRAAAHESVEPVTSAAIVVPLETEPAEIISTQTEQEKIVAEDAAGFQSNPCDGPTAVFMSTCKK